MSEATRSCTVLFFGKVAGHLTESDEGYTWLNARIEETRIGDLHVGQKVQFGIDGYPGMEFVGTICEINPATCSIFSLISTENVAGYFTKLMQRIPIKISCPGTFPKVLSFAWACRAI